MHLKIGTRGSKLAMWQAKWVMEKLLEKGYESTIVPIETKGDKILDVSIAKIGSKGVFTEEIEQQLLDGNIDIAVHSAKDLQSVLDEPFELIAFTEREKENDVVLSDHSISLEQPVKLGTSSTRRVAFLKYYYPEVTTVPVRGNLQTRIQRMREGNCDGLLLAYAGVHRMGYVDQIQQTLSLDKFIPAVGQGSIAIEACKELDDVKKEIVRSVLNHKETEYKLLAERSFLKKLEGGCSIPVFALASLHNNEISIKGGVVALQGEKMIKKTVQGPHTEAEKLGTKLAEKVLEDGGKELLDKIKAGLGAL